MLPRTIATILLLGLLSACMSSQTAGPGPAKPAAAKSSAEHQGY